MAVGELCSMAASLRHSPDATVDVRPAAFNPVTTHRRQNSRFVKVVAGFVGSFVLLLLATSASRRPEVELKSVESPASGDQFRQDADKALELQTSKENYDAAKGRVKKLHEQLNQLEKGLAKELKSMDTARSSLVGRIQDAEGVPRSAPQPTSPPENPPPAAAPSSASPDTAKPSPVQVPSPEKSGSRTQADGNPAGKSSVQDNAGVISEDVMKDLKGLVHEHLQNVEASVTAANTMRDAAYAAEHALGFTQRAATRVGDLAKQSEQQAGRVVEAARLSGEARDAMRAALEQSSQIVDYNAHAASAVAQDAGFVSSGAQAVAGFLHSIFKDSEHVHRAAAAAAKSMDDEVSAVARSKAHAQRMAHQIKRLLDAAKTAKNAAVWEERQAQHAAMHAAHAAKKSVDGEQQSLQDAMKTVAYARIASRAAANADYYEKDAEYRDAITPQYSAHYADAYPVESPATPVLPYSRAGRYGPSGYVPLSATSPYGSYGAGFVSHGRSSSPLRDAKEVVDSVLVLMERMTDALEAAGTDCRTVEMETEEYQREMAAYHSEGATIAGELSAEDMGLVEEYANVQVQSFAADMQKAIDNARAWCGVHVTSYRHPYQAAYTLPPVAPYAPPYSSPPLYVSYHQQGARPQVLPRSTLRGVSSESPPPLDEATTSGLQPAELRSQDRHAQFMQAGPESGDFLRAPVQSEEVSQLRAELGDAEEREQEVKTELARAESA